MLESWHQQMNQGFRAQRPVSNVWQFGFIFHHPPDGGDSGHPVYWWVPSLASTPVGSLTVKVVPGCFPRPVAGVLAHSMVPP